MSIVHDNEIISYEVDFQKEHIKIHTRYQNADMKEEIDILFVDVISHMFEHQLKGSIILDICESGIDHFIKDNKELLMKNHEYCWPLPFKSIEDLKIKLTEENYKYIILMSSYGMNGWVLAKNYKIITKVVKND